MSADAAETNDAFEEAEVDFVFGQKSEHKISGDMQTTKGKLVVLIGPDGVGKTTVARKIIELHPGPALYFHWIPSLNRALLEAPPSQSVAPPPKQSGDGSRVLGWLRLGLNVVRMWLAHVLKIKPALRNGRLVVGDRGLYGYHAQPIPLRYYGPRWLASAAMKWLPQPDLVINLSAPARVVAQRKRELTEPEIVDELKRWSQLPVRRMLTLDSGETPAQIATRVLELLALGNR